MVTSNKVSQFDFVKIWETSKSIKEVMEKTGMGYNAVVGRVNAYRKPRFNARGEKVREGLPLKVMPSSERKPRTNVSELTKLILELRVTQEKVAEATK